MSDATGTAAVVKAAHATIVGEANSGCTNAIVYNESAVESVVSRFSGWIPPKQTPQGYNYHYNHAPGGHVENSSCMNAGVPVGFSILAFWG